jgi:hypothetical protein
VVGLFRWGRVGVLASAANCTRGKPLGAVDVQRRGPAFVL